MQMQASPLFWTSLTLNSVIYKQAEQMQSGHFTATLHLPEYQNAALSIHIPLPAGGTGDGIPLSKCLLQWRGYPEEAIK